MSDDDLKKKLAPLEADLANLPAELEEAAGDPRALFRIWAKSLKDMESALTLARDHMPAEESAKLDRYTAAVIKPTVAQFQRDVLDVYETHGLRAALRAALAAHDELLPDPKK